MSGTIYYTDYTGSVDLNLAVAHGAWATGSVVGVQGYRYMTVAGMFYTGSSPSTAASLGTAGAIYISYSFDGQNWNNYETFSSSMISGSTPYIATGSVQRIFANPIFIRGILANNSGSGTLTGSIWTNCLK